MTALSVARPITVLVVDDNAANRDLVATVLGYHGYVTIEATNGREGLALARRERPDLIITDLLMPLVDGYEFIRQVREDSAIAATPAVFYTANYLESEVAPIAVALGVHHVLLKPISPQVLLRTVNAALDDAPSAPLVVTEEFHREHQRALSSKLVDKVKDLEEVENALLASEARFRSLAQYSPVGIFAMRRSGEVTYANPRLGEICRVERGADIRWDALVHPEDRDGFLSRLASTLEDGGVLDERLRLLVAPEVISWIQIRLAPAHEQSVGVTFVGTVEDISDKVAAEREHEETERRLRISDRLESLGELAAGIAHDFNNVLSLIISYNEFISDGLQAAVTASQEGAELADTLAAALEDSASIGRATERARALTHRLLVFARRDVDRPELVDINHVLDSSLGLLAGTIGSHLKLEFKIDQLPVTVVADPTQLEQVIVNLVVNARDALHGVIDGRIVVSCETVELGAATAVAVGLSPGMFAHLRVRDNGCGISPEVAARVFEPFFTTKPPGEGTGLGLSTVYGIVKGLHGAITIDSKPNAGTVFDIYLPVARSSVDVFIPS